ncbi:MAG: UDP-N-acetylmuramate--L-alanine ligase [Microthrixaceae bacterium]|nr:UDP-N-acetylmuramate--L-alanine ligase [Microthrixaceae bacterium]
MSAIATLLAEAGHEVSGSDAVAGENLETLRRTGVAVRVGHHADSVIGADLVVVSTAVAAGNVEVEAARAAGIPVLNRRQFLPLMAREQPFVSVSGTHGKTSTTSMLAVALRGAGADVSWLIGARPEGLGSAARHRPGPYLVLEADESDGSFLAGPRRGAVVTNLEADHLEFWGDTAALRQGFVEFVEGTEGPVVVCGDDPGSASLASHGSATASTRTYGRQPSCDYRIESLETSVSGSAFRLCSRFGTQQVVLGVPGSHNALNAAGALALTAELGEDLPAAAEALRSHTGVHRRFERRGSAGGVEVVDDYAHLPTEVSAALRAAADTGPRRLVVVFQPHRYSRTEALWAQFAPSFDAADVLVLTDIFPAGEAPREGVSGRLVHDAVARRGVVSPVWAATLPEAAAALGDLLEEGDLLMTVGAGDVREVGDMVLAAREGS